jgi:hypothetical protein
LNNVKVSEYFWVLWLGRSVPQTPHGCGAVAELFHLLWREIAGVIALAGYFAVLPAVMGRTVLKSFRQRLGRGRYVILTLLFLMMLSLPLKMMLRWMFKLSYVVSFPEYFFNF